MQKWGRAPEDAKVGSSQGGGVSSVQARICWRSFETCFILTDTLGPLLPPLAFSQIQSHGNHVGRKPVGRFTLTVCTGVLVHTHVLQVIGCGFDLHNTSPTAVGTCKRTLCTGMLVQRVGCTARRLSSLLRQGGFCQRGFHSPDRLRGWRNTVEIVPFEISNSMKTEPLVFHAYQSVEARHSFFGANKCR